LLDGFLCLAKFDAKNVSQMKKNTMKEASSTWPDGLANDALFP